MPVPQSRLSSLDIGSLIEETIALYHDNGKVFLTICMIVLVPTGIFQLALTLMLDKSDDADDVVQLFAVVLGALPSAFESGVGLLLPTATMIRATSAAWEWIARSGRILQGGSLFMATKVYCETITHCHRRTVHRYHRCCSHRRW